MLQATVNLLNRSRHTNSSDIPLKFEGGLVERLGSQAYCRYFEDRDLAGIIFPAYRLEGYPFAISVLRPKLSESANSLAEVLGNRYDALAVAFLPWFIQRDYIVAATDRGELMLGFHAHSTGEVEHLCKVAEAAYGLNPQIDESQPTYYTPEPGDDELLTEVHYRNAQKLAALV